MKKIKKIIIVLLFAVLVFPQLVAADCSSDCNATTVGEAAFNHCVSQCPATETSSAIDVSSMTTTDAATALSATSNTASSSSGGWNIGSVSGFGLPVGTVSGIITNILKWLLAIFGIVGIIGFVIAGIIYITSFGDDDRMKTAKQAMYYSIIGVIVGLSGLVVIFAVNAILNQTSGF